MHQRFDLGGSYREAWLLGYDFGRDLDFFARMTRIEALKALLEKVEAGEFPRDLDALFRSGAFSTWAQGYSAWRAFQGSLDAAKALDEAIPTPDAMMTPEEMDAVLFHPLGARFWLSWKIRALIAKEEAA